MEAQNKLYYGKIDLSVENNSHTKLFYFLKEHCETHGIERAKVLEVGCNTGYFSQVLSDNGHHVYGIEPCTDEALQLNCLAGFFGGTVEDFFDSDTGKIWPLFDAVVLGDVLEHVVSPQSVIERLAKLLMSNGILLISVPNITHIGVRHMLDDGQWLYKKYGLLDETHKYFFTKHSLRKILINSGFGVERSFHVLTPAIEEYAQTIFHDRIDFENLTKQDHTFQIVVRASRSALKENAFTDDLPKKILLLSPDATASCSILRVVYPLSYYCQKVGGELRSLEEDTTKCLQWADIVVCHRECTREMLLALRIARSMGISIVYDFDDLLFELPSSLSRPSSPLVNMIIRHVAATADKVTCTTPTLRKEVEKITDRVELVPNVIFEKNNLDIAQIHNDTDPCTLVVASTDTIEVGFICEALQEFFKKHSQHSLVVIGKIVPALRERGLDFVAHPRMNAGDFSRILLSVKNGIGIIPLDYSKFSSCKSAIKFYHYAMCGIVSIASNVLPYAAEMEHGKNGWLTTNTTAGWLQAMEHVSSKASIRRRMLTQAIYHVQRYNSPPQAYDAWKRVFHGMPKPDTFAE